MRWIAAVLVVGVLGCGRDGERRSEPFVAAAKACLHEDAEISCPRPIFSVRSLEDSQQYYEHALGFHRDWDHGDPPTFGSVSRGDGVLFLCEGCQGKPGAWAMLFVKDVDKLHEDFKRRGARIQMPPTNMPWGLREMQIADPDGNVLRFGGAIDHDKR